MGRWTIAGACVLAACVSGCVKKATSAAQTIPSVGSVYTGRMEGIPAYVKGDEAHAVLLGGAGAQEVARQLVRAQFRFVYGNMGGGQQLKPHFPNDAVIRSIERIDENTARIVYDVELEVIGSAGDERVKGMVLPLRADEAGLVEFVQKYMNKCAYTEWGNEEVTIEERAQQFFYFFNPSGWECEVRDFRDGENRDTGVVGKMLTLTERSATESLKRAPEYAKIWEDGTLRAVLLIAPTGEGEHAEEGSIEAGLDAGVATYNMLYNKLRRKLPGATITLQGQRTALAEREMPGRDVDYIRFEKNQGDKKIDVHLLFSQAGYLNEVPEESPLEERFHAATLGADLIVYAGHAAFGDNIETINKWGDFRPGQYFLFYVNSCWSIGYLLDPEARRDPDGLLNRIKRINQAESWSKNVDFILNEETSNMYKASGNVMNILSALESRDKTFVDILNSMSLDAIPVVVGEEDNPDL